MRRLVEDDPADLRLSSHYRGDGMRPKAEAIGAFERRCKRAGIRPPERYLLGRQRRLVTNHDIAYPRSTSAAGMRDGHGWIYVHACND